MIDRRIVWRVLRALVAILFHALQLIGMYQNHSQNRRFTRA